MARSQSRLLQILIIPAKNKVVDQDYDYFSGYMLPVTSSKHIVHVSLAVLLVASHGLPRQHPSLLRSSDQCPYREGTMGVDDSSDVPAGFEECMSLPVRK